MRCPFCRSEASRVVDSRDVGDAVRRRRECLNPECGGRFTTYERVQAVALWVVKKDGRREEFSREKLTAGLRKACEKRPLPAGAIETIAGDIESRLYATNASELSSQIIGELVMEHLRALDPIAYVRFASVYREFRDIEALREELEALASGSRPAQGQLSLLDLAQLPARPLRLQPAAPNARTRTRRPVRPVQTPVPLAGKSARGQAKGDANGDKREAARRRRRG
ncbi:MAG TPA: transcriptional regulator NrdR [Dehalococcoidia bacterium]|nr:transcriptional regulator NrdR [Dehalococcoidia bacterium]